MYLSTILLKRVRKKLKTLHKLFHKNYFKLVAFTVFIHTLSIFLIYATIKYELPSLVEKPLTFIGMFFGVSAPFAVFLFNLHFSKNITNLINQNFNRKELFQFFLLNLLMRIASFILVLTISSFVWTSLFTPKEPLNFAFSTYNIFNIYLIGFLLAIIASIIILYGADVKELIADSARAKNKWSLKYFLMIYVGSTAYILFTKAFDVPIIIYYYIIASVFSWGLLLTINRVFKLLPKEKNKFVLPSAALLSLPIMLFTILFRIEIANPNVALKTKVDSVLILGSFNGSFSKKEILSFLTLDNNYNDQKELYTLFDDELSFHEKLQTVTDDKKAKAFSKSHQRQFKEEYVRDYLAKISPIAKENEEVVYDSASFLRNQTVSKAYIYELIKSDHFLDQYASSVLAQKKLKDEELVNFYISNKDTFDKISAKSSLVREAVKRSIASVKKEKATP